MSRTHKLRDFTRFVLRRRVDQTGFQERYGDIKKYKKTCAKAHQATQGTCTVCMSRPSEQLHHSSYRKSGDRIGINCFPVCTICHTHICHHSKNWIIHPEDRKWKNHNTAAFTKMLQQNYKKLQQRIIN